MTKNPMFTIRIVSAIVENDGRYLITQRRKSALMPLLWEFPGGKAEAGESDQDALRRELRERLGADFDIGRHIGEKHHTYHSHDVALALYSATPQPGQLLRNLRVNDHRWVAPADLGKYEFPDADEQMKKYLSESPL